MKIRDEAFWQGQKAEIAQSEDSEEGEAFLKFIELWCDKTEFLIDPDYSPEQRLHGLRHTLPYVEAELGTLPPRWLAHMILVLIGSWAYWDDDVSEYLTVFEERMIADEAMLVNQELQESIT
jgi:hypothetical protein